MKNLALFENKELAVIKNASAAIVERLSDNYAEIIDNMVGKSANTKNQYKRTVVNFLAFIQANGINAHSVGEYRNALEGLDIAESTKNGYLAAAKALCRESLKYGILPVDITANVPQFKTAKGHIKDGVQSDEVKRVLTYLQTIKRDETRLKLTALFHLFVGEGLRQMEAVNLKVKDVNLPDGQILIKGKGKDGKEAHLILESTADALRAWIEFSGIKTGYIFPSNKNTNKPITKRAVRKFFTCPDYGVFVRSKVDGRSVHGFRHFNITSTLDAFDGDQRRAQKRARIKAVQTMQSYDDRRTSKKDVKKLEVFFDDLFENRNI